MLRPLPRAPRVAARVLPPPHSRIAVSSSSGGRRCRSRLSRVTNLLARFARARARATSRVHRCARRFGPGPRNTQLTTIAYEIVCDRYYLSASRDFFVEGSFASGNLDNACPTALQDRCFFWRGFVYFPPRALGGFSSLVETDSGCRSPSRGYSLCCIPSSNLRCGKYFAGIGTPLLDSYQTFFFTRS